MVLPGYADIVISDDEGVSLIIGGASGADIVYGHPVEALDPTALVELRNTAALRIVPASETSRSLAESLRCGIDPSALAGIHAAVVAIAAEVA